ncbi:glycosyltransferase involved in cell wall biosynthesis [Pseudomonas sp. SJZ080]|uniref:glycosyltransferase n=1 Tax=Pseudomonas sp. SJZ080 TaxID=2572888 RepID=UPI00119C39DB|nr:glycosyltransferase [Pseudomonas sp. SJZ080]TWC53430.1 glycosyltransferase involved in cell wall biosynthesis [Pseudomonas sp. SJZ080]
MIKYFYYCFRFVFELLVLPFLAVAALISSRVGKRIDIGLGPFPLINNIYHKRALELAGYSAETFVSQVWHITSNFDVRFDHHWLSKNILCRKLLLNLYIFCWSARRYRALIIYFDGGALGQGSAFLWRLEPYLYRLAGVKTVVLPYGSDVQVMSRSPNLQFKHAMAVDYPQHRTRHAHIQAMVDVWSSAGSHIVGGCEWVDYMHHWDTLMIAHFSIQLPELARNEPRLPPRSGPLKLLHAPNHREIKGTRHVVRAVEELREEGLDIELVMVERVPNEEVRRLILEADIIVDQLVIGWYAMFAIEAMASGKPVICHLRRDLEELYVVTDLLQGFDEIPIIRANACSFKEVIRTLYVDRDILVAAAEKGRGYVDRHHSVEAISLVFSKIFAKLIGPPEGTVENRAC